MNDPDAHPTKIVTLYQDEDGHLEILVDDDVSQFEALGMIQVAYSKQYAFVYDQEIEDESWVGDGEEDE